MDERGESRLKLCGALDAATLARVTRVFESAVAEHCARIIIDLQHVTILDSVGARALRELSTRMKAEGREVVVVGACDQPLLVLKLLRLEALLGEEQLGAPRQVSGFVTPPSSVQPVGSNRTAPGSDSDSMMFCSPARCPLSRRVAS